MAHFIPLDATVYINRASFHKDDWGIPLEVVSRQEYKARVDFNGNSRLVRGPEGESITFACQVFIKGAVLVGYNDTVEYYSPTSGWVVDNPKQIVPMNGLDGKTLYTRLTV